MLAWPPESGGQAWDLRLGARAYRQAHLDMLDYARSYRPARILLPVGNDLFHANQNLHTGGAGTHRGTPVDVDGRLAKVFGTVAALVSWSVDAWAELAPVDVLVVPGNHDRDEVFRLGLVLEARYRSSRRVRVRSGPEPRKYYGWRGVALMLTHGERLARVAASLPLIMATECPPSIWSSARCREVLTGHHHRRIQGRVYLPGADVNEDRGVVVRSLPALTSPDAWHHSMGYAHRQAATLLAYGPGYLLGLHETRP
ncbi:MAG: hypothetical protein QN204_04985 [Armatimonadota bacterium]|nr:hypothetical protein [Armatimonadota bacterium]